MVISQRGHGLEKVPHLFYKYTSGQEAGLRCVTVGRTLVTAESLTQDSILKS